MSCTELPIERLVAYVDGELAAHEAADVERHVGLCAACAREADLLRRSGALVERLPRFDPGPEFTSRVVAAAAARPPRGGLRRLMPVAAAAALLVSVLAFRAWSGRQAGAGAGELAAREEQAIAEDLYLLANLDALETTDADELISMVENLDLLEGTEPEVAGMFGDVEPATDGEDGG